jgi:hypothetical protein
MKRNTLFLGVLVCILTLGVMLVSCDDGGEKTTAWSAVERLEQLDGEWKGSYRESGKLIELMGDDADFLGEEFKDVAKGINVTINAEITLTINAAAETFSGQMKRTETYSGNNIDAVWSFLSLFPPEEGVVDNSKHSITFHEVMPEEHIYEDDWKDLEIDQGGKKIKMPAGTFGEDSPAVEFTKQ